MGDVLRAIHTRWPYAPVAVMYVVALALVANFAFGAEFLATGPLERPARTSQYGNGLTSAAPIDLRQIAQAISEANGGPPTIGQARPVVTLPATPLSTPASAPARSVSISPTTTPTYEAATTVSTLPYASLLALIPTNLTFPSPASSHHRR
jgi:hypothetical protein